MKRGTAWTLASNNDDDDYNSSNIVTAFNSTGFGLGTDAVVNEDGKTYIAWMWNAPTAFSLTTGDIDSSGYKNTTAGFSIVSYTGTGSSGTIPHGLSAKPEIVIIKNRDADADWGVYFDLVDGSMDRMLLNDSGAKSNQSVSAPTATFFSTQGGSGDGANGEKYIAYCFAPVAGYSAFGTYTGSSGEPFVYTGFKPAYVLLKRTDNNASWYVFDNARNSYNEVTSALRPNSNVTEQAYNISMMSNGFLIETSSDGDINGAGANYLWYSFAESPMKTARAR